MGTGVGEAMLIGAAVGGGTSALTGGDPLKGAIIGAAGGGFGSALPAAFSAASAAPAIGSSTAASSFGSALGAGTGAGGAGFGATGISAGAGALPTTFTPFGTTVGTSALSSALPAVTPVSALPAVGGGAGFGGIGATGAAGYTPGMYQGLAAAPTNAVSSIPFSTQTLTSANPPFSIRDLLSKAPTPDITGDSEAQRQVIKATGKNIFGYMPGDKGFLSDPMLAAIGGGSALLGRKDSTDLPGEEDYVSSFDPSKFIRSTPTYAPGSVYVPEYKDYRTAAEGGIMRLAVGGSVDDEMGGDYSAMGMDQGNMQKGLFGLGYANGGQINLQGTVNLDQNSMGPSNTMVLPQPTVSPGGPGGLGTPQLAVLPRTMSGGGIAGILESARAQGLTPEAYQQIYGRGNKIVAMQKALKEGQIVDGMARGGISSLGGYSDGGRMLKGPGDGMSDSIPASIANKQPARLADGEFVVPADVVSHLGNGSTDAGAKQLYAMMDKVRKARTGKKKQAPAVKANRYMPA
jgi:hypothetical protein